MKILVCLSALIVSFGAGSLSARDKGPLHVGSYNIRMNTTVDKENAWPHRKDRVKALIQFHEYDIVGVQEALPGQMDDLRRMPGFASVGIGRDGEAGGEHSAIFYRTDRVRVLDSGTFWLSQTPEAVSKGWDAQLHRVCTWAKMKDLRTRRVFYFFNTHLDHIGPVARKESARLIVERMAAVASRYPVMCTGDFNSQPSDEPIVIMKEAFRSAREISQTPPYGPTWSYTGFAIPVSEKLRGKQEIDYLFVNDRVKVLRFGILSDSDGRNFPSDHFPLIATVVLE